MKVPCLLVSCVGLAVAALSVTAAFAGDSRIYVEASVDGGSTWRSGLVVLAPGTFVQVRVRVQYVGTETVLGLAGVTFQPTISNWTPSAGDVLSAFTSVDGACVPDAPSSQGRVTPFCASRMYSASSSGALTALLDSGNILRFAGANCVAATTNLTWGVACSQPPMSVSTNFRSGADVVVFRYTFTLGTHFDFPALTATVPLETFLGGRVSWFRQVNGTGSLLSSVQASDIQSVQFGDPGPPPCQWHFATQPSPQVVRLGRTANFVALPSTDGGNCSFTYRWQRNGTDLSNDARISGATGPSLSIHDTQLADAGTYRLRVEPFLFASQYSNPASLNVLCPADLDDGTGAGAPDGGVTIDDLLFYLRIFAQGQLAADVDDGSGTGTPDGGVTIDDLLYYLQRFEAGC